MVRAMFAAGLSIVSATTVAAQSVSSCGADSDHMSSVVATVSPDPPVRGQPFTMSISGVFDEALTEGTIDYALHFEALGIVKTDFNKKYAFKYNPGLGAGEASLVVGPVTFPDGVPAGLTVTGKIKVENSLGEPVSCIALNMASPALTSSSSTLSDTAGCDRTTEPHLTNLALFDDGAGMSVATALLDEDLSIGIVDMDIQISALFMSLPIQYQVPISFTPGFPKGQHWLSLAPIEEAPPADDIISITGTLRLEDESKEDVACWDFSGYRPVPVIKSVSSGMCLDLPGGDTTNGNKLWAWECYDGDSQQWVMETSGELKYNIDRSKCVDIYNGDVTSGTRLGIWDCGGWPQQLWEYSSDANTLVSKLDNTKCMDLSGGQAGAPVQIWDCVGNDKQQWTVTGRVPTTPSQAFMSVV